MKKLIKKFLVLMLLVTSCFLISPTGIKAESESSTSSDTIYSNFELSSKDVDVFNLYYDSTDAVVGTATIPNGKQLYYTAVAFNVPEEITNLVSFSSIDYKYKYCSKSWTILPGVNQTKVCLKKKWSKEKTVYEEETFDVYNRGLLTGFDDKKIGTFNKIGSLDSLREYNLIYDLDFESTDLLNYDYYFVLTKKATYEELIVNVNYIDKDGNLVIGECKGSGCHIDYGTAVPSDLEEFLAAIWSFFEDYGPLILLFIIVLLIGIWVTPVFNVLNGVIKMVIKILDYAWTTLVNACIGVHNIWFWLFTRDDYKRKGKMKSYKKYD